MPNIVFGSIALTSAGQPTAPSFGQLKRCAAKVVRGEGQAKYLDLAADGILAGIDDINMRHLFNFGSQREASYTMVSGTQGVALPTDFLGVREVQLVDFTTDKPTATLPYIDWEQFNLLEPGQDDTGVPQMWTSRNPYLDEEILLYPVPNATAVADKKLRLEYFARINLPAADGDVVIAPRELGDILCTYGQYHILFVLDNQNAVAWNHKLQLYKDKLRSFLGSQNRVRSAQPRWVMDYENDLSTNGVDPLGD